MEELGGGGMPERTEDDHPIKNTKITNKNTACRGGMPYQGTLLRPYWQPRLAVPAEAALVGWNRSKKISKKKAIRMRSDDSEVGGESELFIKRRKRKLLFAYLYR